MTLAAIMLYRACIWLSQRFLDLAEAIASSNIKREREWLRIRR